MADPTITDAVKQTVITRLATINSATSILSLINGRPAKVTTDEVLDLAEHIERWAWRDLLGKDTDNRTPEKPAPPAEATKPAPSRDERIEPGPATGKDDRIRPTPARQHTNGNGQRPGGASPGKISAIFGVGRSKGYSTKEIKDWVQRKRGKSIDELTDHEASGLIDDLKAL